MTKHELGLKRAIVSISYLRRGSADRSKSLHGDRLPALLYGGTIVLIFSSENPQMLQSSSGQEVDVFVRKQGRNWSFDAGRRSGEHSKPRGSIVHVLEDAIVSHGSVDNGWAEALCGDAPRKGGGWQLLPTSSHVTCKKCEKLRSGNVNK